MSAAREICSCRRAQVELGCDLCAFCRLDYEERQRQRLADLDYAEELQAEKSGWNDRATGDPE